MIVSLYRPARGGEPVIFEADIVTVTETDAGGLQITQYSVVGEDAELVSQGTFGYARGQWEWYEEAQMPSDEVKQRVFAAEQRIEERETAEHLRVGQRRS